MTCANDNAYPSVYEDQRGGGQWVNHGLTKRELFAAMAMQGIASCYPQWPVPSDGARLSEVSVALADALIAELSR